MNGPASPTTGPGPGRATLAQAGKAEPQRTCVGCRCRASRSLLLRVVAVEVDGRWFVEPDPRRRRPGRGAWLHDDRGCLEAAERRSAFNRALRRSGPMNTERLRKLLTGHDDQQDAPGIRGRRESDNDRNTVQTGSGSNADEHPMSTQR